MSLLLCSCAVTQEAVKPTAVAHTPSVTDADKASTYAALKAELEKIGESDQSVRQGYKVGMDQKATFALWEKMQVVDGANQRRLDEIVKLHGWPEVKDVGAKAAFAAFMVVQHSPAEDMKRYFPMVQKAMERGDLSKNSFAMFDDRVRMYEKRPQRYGTQINGDAKGIRTFWQIEDEVNVDKRRAEVGLDTLAEYAKRSKVEYIPYAKRDAKAQAATPESKK